MITWLAGKIANYLSKHNDNSVSKEILSYSLILIINTLSVFVLSSAIYVTFWGKFYDIIVTMASFGLLRSISGGYHLKSGLLCIIVSSTLMLGIAYTSQFIRDYITILSLISIFLILLFAPSKIENQTNIPKKYYGILKILSASLVLINDVFINDSAIALSFFVQSLSLIHFDALKGGEKENVSKNS